MTDRVGNKNDSQITSAVAACCRGHNVQVSRYFLFVFYSWCNKSKTNRTVSSIHLIWSESTSFKTHTYTSPHTHTPTHRHTFFPPQNNLLGACLTMFGQVCICHRNGKYVLSQCVRCYHKSTITGAWTVLDLQYNVSRLQEARTSSGIVLKHLESQNIQQQKFLQT